MVISKALTYLSYEYVPVSLSHTAKATSPIFTVLLSYYLYKNIHIKETYVSLLLVVLGVILASTSEIQYNHIGFFSAIIATIVGM